MVIADTWTYVVYQSLNSKCNSLVMGKALSQISGNLIFQVYGYFYKNFPFYWNIDDVR